MVEDFRIVPEYVRFEAGKILEKYIDILDDEYTYSSEKVILQGFHYLITEGYLKIKDISRELTRKTGKMVTIGMVEEWFAIAEK